MSTCMDREVFHWLCVGEEKDFQGGGHYSVQLGMFVRPLADLEGRSLLHDFYEVAMKIPRCLLLFLPSSSSILKACSQDDDGEAVSFFFYRWLVFFGLCLLHVLDGRHLHGCLLSNCCLQRDLCAYR